MYRSSYTNRPFQSGRNAYTLIETLVVMSIIALLLSIMLPSISKARDQMKKMKCASNMRSMAINFQLFAEGQNADGQGDSEKLGPNRFYINDFQDSEYHLDEFWDRGATPTGTLDHGNDAMLCPAGAKNLTKRKGYPCSREAITPA